MARHPITPEMQAALLESFRTDVAPGTFASFRRAAAAAGVDRRLARKAWNVGVGSAGPVKDQIERERTLARAALARETLAKRVASASSLAMEDASASRSRAEP